MQGSPSYHMPKFRVQVIIENKPGIRDPEGETILNDLVLKKFGSVSEIRTARMLKFLIFGKTARTAEEEVRRICDDLRIYNPLVSSVRISSITD